ncbi:MAG: hypothetical protein K2X46_17045 [Roseomonas sp.]|nr:hypothetical protein [Roseomonas sp.]
MVQDNDAPGAAAPLLADQGVKPWWLSKTIIGAGIGAAGMGLAFTGYQIDPETQRVLIDQSYAFASAALALVGTITVIVGRFMAQKAIGKAKV